MIQLFIKLLMGHAIADFSLQTSTMASGKNRNRLIDPSTIPPGQTPQTVWPYWLGSHGLIHGAMVTLITGNVYFGLIEAVSHICIDFGKCENWYGIHTDQFLHMIFLLLIAWRLA